MKYVRDTTNGSPRMGITLYIVINPHFQQTVLVYIIVLNGVTNFCH